MNKPKLRQILNHSSVLTAFAALAVVVTAGCGGGGGASFTSAQQVSSMNPGDTELSANVAGVPALGIGASLNGKPVFPADNAWNTRIDTQPVDPNSAAIINSIGLTTHIHPDFGSNTLYGIPYIVVPGTQALVPIKFTAYGSESDPGPYPVPANAPIEGGPSGTGDRHVIVIDRDHWKLFELDYSFKQANGSWNANCGATWNLNNNVVRPAGWTSADAAGLPIFPGLVRYDEVSAGAINHAIRFTVQHSRHAYVYPARHYASSLTGTQYPPMGMRVRLKASVNISGFTPQAKVIAQAMKTYGLIVADNGSNWYFQGASDSRFNDNDLGALKNLTGASFEVVKMGTVVTQ